MHAVPTDEQVSKGLRSFAEMVEGWLAELRDESALVFSGMSPHEIDKLNRIAQQLDELRVIARGRAEVLENFR